MEMYERFQIMYKWQPRIPQGLQGLQIVRMAQVSGILQAVIYYLQTTLNIRLHAHFLPGGNTMDVILFILPKP
jgi:hypothetical protein